MTKSQPEDHILMNTDPINNLLIEWANGNLQVENQLIEALYPYIHQIAQKQFKSAKGSALQTTEIVNEAFINIRKQKSRNWKNKQHFFAVAAKVIRNVVVNHYRAEAMQKRGGLYAHVSLERLSELIEDPKGSGFDWLSIDRLLTELASIDAASAQVVEYKLFGGLTIPEMAKVLSVSESTVSRNWKFARLWLLSQLQSD